MAVMGEIYMVQLRRKPVSPPRGKIHTSIAEAISRTKNNSFYHKLSLRGDNPLYLLGTPKVIWPGSPSAGAKLVYGKIVADGHILENPKNDQNLWLGGDVWRATNLNNNWLEYLHSFRWLIDLHQAENQEGAKKRGQELVAAWIEQNNQWGAVSWGADVVGERNTNWLLFAPLILDTEDLTYRRCVLDMIARHARFLMNISTDEREALNNLRAIVGLTLSGLFVPGGESWLKKGCSLLRKAVEKEVFADDALRSQAPQKLLQLYLSFVLLGEAFKKTGREEPEEVLLATLRMATNLENIIHGDGKLALFNGVGIQSDEDIYLALLRTGQKDNKSEISEQSGFARIEKRKSLIIIDVGPPPELDKSAASHCGTHAFEMSRGRERLVVNCGAAPFINGSKASLISRDLRGSAAHSTLVLNNKNSSKIREDGLIGPGVSKVSSRMIEGHGQVLIESEHDGYVLSCGYLHKRLIYVSETGENVRGEDIIEHHEMRKNLDKVPFNIRFHLHPDVSVTQNKQEEMLCLSLESGELWYFRYRGAEGSLESSTYFGKEGKGSASKQIVLSGETGEVITTVLWSLQLE